MDWKIFAIISPLMFVIYQTLSKVMPKNISTYLVYAYVSLVSAVLMLVLHILFTQQKSMIIEGKNVWIILGMGIFVGLGNLFVIKAYSLGAPQSLFTSIYTPLFIIYGIVFGVLIWSEKLNIPQVGGIILSLIGVILVAYFQK